MKRTKRKCIMEFIPMGMFPGGMMLTYGFNHSEMIEELRIQNTESANEWILAFDDAESLIDNSWCGMYREMVHVKTKESKRFFMINIPEVFNFKDPDHYCKLAHEVLHICQFYLPDVLDRNKEHEAEAYLHTFLMREILKLIKK